MKTDFSLKDARAAAKRGALLLDTHRPGWAEDVDVRTLDMGECRQCVLGQLYQDFFPGLGRLNLPAGHEPDLAAHFGLRAPWGVRETLTRCYDRLLTAWKEQIQERR